jgi:hypothetical protein
MVKYSRIKIIIRRIVMKKFLWLFSVVVMLLGIVLFSLLPADHGVDTSQAPPEGGGSGGGGTTLWNRYDDDCPDGIRQKTICRAGGSEQCTAQYCN